MIGGNLTADYTAFNKSAAETVDRFFPVVGLPLHLVTAGSLLLIAIGRFSDFDEALYLTALITAQIFAGYTLFMLVLSQKHEPPPDSDGG